VHCSTPKMLQKGKKLDARERKYKKLEEIG
jgi:hypothetical protein